MNHDCHLRHPSAFDLTKRELIVLPALGSLKQPSVVELKDALYTDWRAAGLPMQVELPTLLRQKSP